MGGGYMDTEPLKPVYKVQRPPWIGYFTGQEYKGRPNWWAELGYTDALTPQQKLRPQHYQLREQDPEWWDPPVEDGTSIPGPYGNDSRYGPANTVKADQPGNLFDYKKNLVETSSQYKNIIEKYKLSPEHPGLDVSPSNLTLRPMHNRELGVGTFLSQTWHQWGPRFFDKPMNEGCVEKGLALVKYVAIGNIIATCIQWKTELTDKPKALNWVDMAKRYARLFPYPATVAFGYGVSICTAATIRHRDDIYNPMYAAGFTGILISTIKNNIPLGISYALCLAVLGTFWHYGRISRWGLQGPQMNPMYSSPFYFGPHLYKAVDFGGTEIPKDTY